MIHCLVGCRGASPPQPCCWHHQASHLTFRGLQRLGKCPCGISRLVCADTQGAEAAPNPTAYKCVPPGTGLPRGVTPPQSTASPGALGEQLEPTSWHGKPGRLWDGGQRPGWKCLPRGNASHTLLMTLPPLCRKKGSERLANEHNSLLRASWAWDDRVSDQKSS